jgi:hypothetical protein
VSEWLPRSGEWDARVASITKINLQCLQTLEEEGYNEHAIAMPRMAFSAMLLSISSRPSVRKRVSAARRLMV